jgi:hypothetical protein
MLADTITYYSNEGVQLELVKQLAFRELAFANVDAGALFRDCVGYNKPLLLSSFSAFRLFDKKSKVYHSVGKVARTPWISYNPAERKAGLAQWQEQFNEHLTEYDFVLDIDDAEDLERSHAVAATIKDYLDKHKVKYYICSSGSKGFHIRVRGETIAWPAADKPLRFKAVAEALEKLANPSETTKIDDIYQTRRLIKLPYSIDGSSEKVVLPLTDQQFKDYFELDLSPQAVLSRGVAWRGLQERQGEDNAFLTMYDNLKGETNG